jgi:dissimilatory sulfite reductase (desulfoviridin) alpha/beta subunit
MISLCWRRVNGLSDADYDELNTYPVINSELCVECNKCVSDCDSLSFGKRDGKIVLNRSTCFSCGHCVQVCPSQAINAKETGYAVYLGGRFGRVKQAGTQIGKLQSADGAATLAGKIIDYLEQNAKPGERLGAMIDRIGRDEMLSMILI